MSAPEISIYNTVTRSKEPFKPIDPKNVRLYACGPTVYDFAHIGNGRTAVTFDLVFRVLRHAFGEDHVTYVRNITDIDDKIIGRAQSTGRTIAEVTAETAKAYQDDMLAVGALAPTHEPRATAFVVQMVEMIGALVERGNAYEAEGHVLFEVGTFDQYGALSGRSLDDMIAGARVEVAPYKKNAMDFVLWKPSEEGQPGWDSPWGKGRPGWHIECSAMSAELLGQTFDIHGGGTDLTFPHHENEVAQSTCVHGGATMARFWMHGGYLQVNGEKMSKSLGNFITVHDLLKDWPGEAIRLHLLMTHYRQPLNWTIDGIKEAKTVLDRWYRLIGDTAPSADVPASVLAAVYDDFNTPKAIAEMHAAGSSGPDGISGLVAAGRLLGLFRHSAEEWARWTAQDQVVDEAAILTMIEARNAARKSKDFAEADRLRDELKDMGVVIEDGPDGTTWRVA